MKSIVDGKRGLHIVDDLNKLLGLYEYIIQKIQRTKTIGQLNFMRKEVFQFMSNGEEENFYEIQKIFRKQKNKLMKVPLKDRPSNWEDLVDVDSVSNG